MAVRDLIDRPRPLVVSGRPASPRERATEGNRRITGHHRIRRGPGPHRRARHRRPPPRAHRSARRRQPAVQPRSPSVPCSALVGSFFARAPGSRQAHLSSPGHHVVLGTEEVLGTRRPGVRRIDRETVRPGLPERAAHRARRRPGHHDPPARAPWLTRDGYAIAEFPVRILRIPAAEAEQFTPARPGRAAIRRRLGHPRGRCGPRGPRPGRPAGAPAPAGPGPPPRPAPRRNRRPPRPGPAGNSTCSTNCKTAAIGGLIDGTLTLTSDELNGQDE